MAQPSDYVIIIFLSFTGFLIASYIRHHKKNIQEALICPLKANCDTVIHSDYSKFLGVPVENLGMTYYAFTAAGYGLIIIFPAMGLPWIASGLMLSSVFAFAFSIYLTAVQAFALKNWCTWCLISASICGVIFALAATDSPLFSGLFSNLLLTL